MGRHSNDLSACDVRGNFLYSFAKHLKITIKNMNKALLMLAAFTSMLWAGSLMAENPAAPSASLTIQNRSGYLMDSAIWQNGENCSKRMLQGAPVDINSANASAINAPAGKPMAIGVAIYEMRGKSPVVCDYILSFTLSPSRQYRLEYDVYDRRCYGQLFREETGTYKLVQSGDAENVTERFPEFGWDQSEPGCAKEKGR